MIDYYSARIASAMLPLVMLVDIFLIGYCLTEVADS